MSENGYHIIEGHSGQVPEETVTFQTLVRDPSVKTVMEIGFNAGHSASTFLKANPNIKLVSFDIGNHEYLHGGKKFIDLTYPGRHTLVLGPSLDTVPKYIRENPGVTFDVILIDGAHDYPNAKGDLINCLSLAHKNTTVIIDDVVFVTTPYPSYSIGPTILWVESLISKYVIQTDFALFSKDRGLVWGKYNENLFNDSY